MVNTLQMDTKFQKQTQQITACMHRCESAQHVYTEHVCKVHRTISCFKVGMVCHIHRPIYQRWGLLTQAYYTVMPLSRCLVWKSYFSIYPMRSHRV